jgi:hypothetical protein
MTTRVFEDDQGTAWEAFAADRIVAHGRPGAVLSFRRVGGDPDEYVTSTITFNSFQAAAFALETMSEKELRRRMSLAVQAAGV